MDEYRARMRRQRRLHILQAILAWTLLVSAAFVVTIMLYALVATALAMFT